MDRQNAAVNEDILKASFARTAAEGTPSHAYIIEGEDEQTLRDLADHFVRLLLCESHTGCGRCRACRYLAEGGHPDLMRVVPEKPGTIKVDDIREKLVSDMGIRPYEAQYKIYVIEHAEWMNVQAQNALLKTLEEPPSYGVILLLSCNTEALLPTIISRSVRLRAMTGGHGWDRLPDEAKEKFLSVFRGLGRADAAYIKRTSEEIAEEYPDPGMFIGAVRTWIRDIMALKLSGAEEQTVIKEALPALRAAAGDYTWRQINDILKMTDTAQERIASGVNTAWSYELLLSQMR